MSVQKISPRQFGIFVAGGAACALIDIGLMWWLLHLGAAPLVATSAGFFAGLVVNYAFHTRVTFNSRFTTDAFVRFMTVVAINYLLTVAVVALAVLAIHDAFVPSAVIGKLVAVPLVAINGYWLSRHWVFK